MDERERYLYKRDIIAIPSSPTPHQPCSPHRRVLVYAGHAGDEGTFETLPPSPGPALRKGEKGAGGVALLFSACSRWVSEARL